MKARRENIELNAVATAIALIDSGGLTEGDILEIRGLLKLFCDYVHEHERQPIFWHDFVMKREAKRVLEEALCQTPGPR